MTKVILVTGASSGIGKITAEHLVREGYRVFGTSRKADVPAATGITMLQLDVRNPESIRDCVAQIIRQAGRLDVLINNAAIVGPAAAAEEICLSTWRSVFDTNLFGVIEMTNAVLPVMRQQGHGQIINISSMAGFMAAPPYFSTYIASKHALEGYTETLRYEVAPFGIHVSLIQIGYVVSNIEQSIVPPDQPIADYEASRQRVYEADLFCLHQGNDPEMVAQRVLGLIATKQPRLRYSAGTEALTMAWAKRLLPFAIFERAIRWLFMEGKWDARHPGLRRVFLDARLLKKVWQVSLVLGAVMSILLAGLVLRSGWKSPERN